MKEYESWSVGNGEINLYTENHSVAKVFKQFSERVTIYERNGKVFGWQCYLPKEKLGFVEMQIKKNLSIENQQVTGVQNFKYQFTDMNPIRSIHSQARPENALHNEKV